MKRAAHRVTACDRCLKFLLAILSSFGVIAISLLDMCTNQFCFSLALRMQLLIRDHSLRSWAWARGPADVDSGRIISLLFSSLGTTIASCAVFNCSARARCAYVVSRLFFCDCKRWFSQYLCTLGLVHSAGRIGSILFKWLPFLLQALSSHALVCGSVASRCASIY